MKLLFLILVLAITYFQVHSHCVCPRIYKPVTYKGKRYSNFCLAKCSNPGITQKDVEPAHSHTHFIQETYETTQ